MSRGKKGGNSGAHGAGDDDIAELDPAGIYFTFSRIRPSFSCGRTIKSTMEQLLRREITPRDLPLLCIFTDGRHYYSQNNRRLYMYKRLKELGELETVPVRLRALPNTRRMVQKYTPEKCALTATLMGSGGGATKGCGATASATSTAAGDANGGGSGGEDDGCDSTAVRRATDSEEEAERERGQEEKSVGERHRVTAQRVPAAGLREAAGYRFGRVDSLASEGNVVRPGEGFTVLAENASEGALLPTTIKGLRLNVEIVSSTSTSTSTSSRGNEEGDGNDDEGDGGRGHGKKRHVQASSALQQASNDVDGRVHPAAKSASTPTGKTGGSRAQRKKKARSERRQHQCQHTVEQEESGTGNGRRCVVEDDDDPHREEQEETARGHAGEATAAPERNRKGKKTKGRGPTRRRAASTSSSSSFSSADNGCGGNGKGVSSLEEELRALGLH